MKFKMFAVVAVLAIVLATVTPAAAITGGQPDGTGHPYSGLILVPGYGICSGTLIDEDLVLTAGHCTAFFDEARDAGLDVLVTFDSEAAVDLNTWENVGGTWYEAASWVTYATYSEADWPFTDDYGLVMLKEPVDGVTPALLPEAGLLTDLIGTKGQTSYRFNDVGYGQNGVYVGIGQPPWPRFDFTRRVSVQRWLPSKGSTGTLDPRWFVLGNVPSPTHGSGCGGDSGSGIFPAVSGDLGNTVVAVHTGGYSLGFDGAICGRISSLNHRIDIPDVLAWIMGYMD